MRFFSISALALFTIAPLVVYIRATLFEQNITRHALSERHGRSVQAWTSWIEKKMWRQHFTMVGLSCADVTSAFANWPGAPSDKEMNIQCWVDDEPDWQFDLSVWNNQAGKCTAACAIDAMGLDTQHFCTSYPDTCCDAGKCPS